MLANNEPEASYFYGTLPNNEVAYSGFSALKFVVMLPNSDPDASYFCGTLPKSDVVCFAYPASAAFVSAP